MGLSNRLNTAEEKINEEREDFTTETLQNETQRDHLKVKRSSVSSGTMSLKGKGSGKSI